MSQKHFLLKGTFILTVVGILTRVMGFFYRIFLSRSFPAEEIGLYQLIFPVYTLAYAATSAGIETALARLVAASSAKKQSAKAYSYLKAALLCSLFLSICCLFLLQKNAVFLTTVILGDPRCASLIFLIAYALPFAALHSCSCGYFLGLKQIRLPALSQLFEQLVRIFFVIFLYTADAHTAFTPSVAIAVLGIVGGEIATAFLCIHKLRTAGQPLSPHREPALSAVPPLLFSALPLTASRVLLNLFQSLEAISIPLALQKYGMSISASLSTYQFHLHNAPPRSCQYAGCSEKACSSAAFTESYFFLPVSWFCLPAIFLYRIRLYQQTDLSYTRSRKLYLNTSIYLSFSL